jgi:hypothetical protein
MRIFKATGLIALCLSLGFFIGCENRNEITAKQSEKVTAQDVQKEAKEAYDTTKMYSQQQIDAFQQNVYEAVSLAGFRY